MCGRFGIAFDPEELTDRFHLSEPPPRYHSSYNVAPSFTIPAITKNSPNKAVLMHWGFVPSFLDPTKAKMKPINARDDTVATSGFYRTAFASTRCIIPFSFFYEWQKYTLDGKEEKQPYLIRVKEEKVMGFAGIYSERKDAEGMPYFTCAIITTTPNILVGEIHNRMPVILHKEHEDMWLDKDTNIEDVKGLLRPFEADKMESYRISKEVNSPRNDSPDLIKPI